MLAADPSHELALDLLHPLRTRAGACRDPPDHRHYHRRHRRGPATSLVTAHGDRHVRGRLLRLDRGPVLQHWGPEPIRDWAPADGHGFETAADRLPSELTALGTRQTRGST